MRDETVDFLTEPLIAVPGDSKMEMASGLFERIWRKAEDAIKEAAEIYLIGFRFPPSDAYPRGHVLDALAQNQNLQKATIVLGPDLNADLRRVRALIEWSTKAGDDDKRVKVEPLWAEDFLDGWARNELKSMDRIVKFDL